MVSGYSFAEKSHLNRHYSFHSEKRPFQCTICLKMYKTERCLKVHAMVHAEARPYVCTYCNKGFLSTTKLKVFYDIMDKSSVTTFTLVTVYMGTASIPFMGGRARKFSVTLVAWLQLH